MQVLEAHHFRLPACRFVLDLFEKRVLEQIVLEEEDDEGEVQEEADKEESASEYAAEQQGVNGTTRAWS